MTLSEIALCRPRALCALALLALTNNVAAHLPELYGRDYVREPDAAVVPESEKQKGDALDQARQLEQLEADLSARETRRGPYAPELSDPILQLAALHASGGNPVEGLRHYEQALHLIRINNGLLHPAQLPVLRKLAELYARIGDWRSAQLAWRYAYRVHGMGQEALSEESLADALSYFAFARNAYIAPNSAGDDRLFMQAYSDNDALFERLAASDETDFATLHALGLSQLRNLYVLLGTDLSGVQGMGGAPAMGTSRMLTLQELGLGKGLEILDLLLEAAADQQPATRSHLHLRRGNWLQWNGKWRRSREDYAALFRHLAENASGEAMRAQLAVPAELPEDGALWEFLQADNIPVRAVVRASYTVSERGNASELDVEGEGDTPSGLAGRIRRMLSDSHYRPALIDGQTVEGRIENRRYRLID